MLVTADDLAFVTREFPDVDCRLCGDNQLVSAFDMGPQANAAVFPTADEVLPKTSLNLLHCPRCHLVQIAYGCDHLGLYESGSYGYRSGQNPQMVAHLTAKADELSESLMSGDAVLDIGANDGTLLNAFPKHLNRIGFDPTSLQWQDYFPPDVAMNTELFSSKAYLAKYPKAKVITSLSMLYDLEDPVEFARQVAECLTDDGVWHFEQCYLRSTIDNTVYDTICHEHLTYYSLRTIQELLRRVGMTVESFELNDINGGSIAVTARKGAFQNHWLEGDDVTFDELRSFAATADRHRDLLVDLLRYLKSQGHTIGALGASTKGNTLLQFCGLGPDLIEGIGEVNPNKIGRYTPGSNIPIVDESEVLGCDYLLVLPWHFKSSFRERYAGYLAHGGRLIFPLPDITTEVA